MENCIFCKIVKGEIPCHKVWEDDKHIAFLSIFPNTDGFTVVTTKKHYPSYAFNLEDNVLTELTLAAKKVGKMLDASFDDVGRTGLVYEGFGVDHVHAKLIPLHGTKNMAEWKPLQAKRDDFYKVYPGYMSTHDAQKANDEKLKQIAQKIRMQK